MDTVPQTVNCVDVLPRTSRHLHSHLLWTSLEPEHCHCAVCLMEPHMNISKPSVNKSNTRVRTLISRHKRRTLVILKILFLIEQENAWDFNCAEWERETHRKCASLTRDAWDLAGVIAGDGFVGFLLHIAVIWHVPRFCRINCIVSIFMFAVSLSNMHTWWFYISCRKSASDATSKGHLRSSVVTIW